MMSSIYNIKGKVGTGGFSFVYLGKHNESGRAVAIKHYKRPKTFEDSVVFGPRRETDLMKHVNNPFVLHLYEDRLESNRTLIGELCTGGSLLEKLNGSSYLPLESIRKIFTQIAIGVQAIHAADIFIEILNWKIFSLIEKDIYELLTSI